MILFKVTSRSRPEKLVRTIENILNHVTETDFLIMCTLDEDDLSLVPIREKLAAYPNTVCHYGTSRSKVDAINRDMDKAPDNWSILVNVSDDQVFLIKGFDRMIKEEVGKAGGDCFLHFPDSNAKHHLATMSIMDRKYYNRDGYIYHNSYQSLWCDNEAQAVAKQRGRYFFIPKQIFDHLHPAYKKAEWDPQYHKTESFYTEDRNNFRDRESKNFDI